MSNNEAHTTRLMKPTSAASPKREPQVVGINASERRSGTAAKLLIFAAFRHDWRVLAPTFHNLLRHVPWRVWASSWAALVRECKLVVRWLSMHTGLPALFVTALLVVVGFRLLKRTTRFAAQVAVVTLALVAVTTLGWIHW